MRKEETAITRVNGGMHNQRKYKRMKEMIDNCNYYRPRLYHLEIMNSEQSQELEDALTAVVRELRRNGMPCEWHSCLEVDFSKGLHLHTFIIVEAQYYNPCSILNHKGQEWLTVMMQQRGLKHHIAEPKDPMHQPEGLKKRNYAVVEGEDRIADCKVWISYLVKRRSKEDSMRNIYSSSRNQFQKENE